MVNSIYYKLDKDSKVLMRISKDTKICWVNKDNNLETITVEELVKRYVDGLRVQD